MKALPAVSCAILLLVLSGCAGTPASTSSPTSGPQPATGAAMPQVLRDQGTLTAGVGAGLSLTLGAGGVAPSVKANVTLMLIELRWAGPVDLDLCIQSPSSENTAGVGECEDLGDGGMPGLPDSPVQVAIPAPEQGAWTISPYADGAAAETEYELAVTLFRGETAVPAGYTALP